MELKNLISGESNPAHTVIYASFLHRTMFDKIVSEMKREVEDNFNWNLSSLSPL